MDNNQQRRVLLLCELVRVSPVYTGPWQVELSEGLGGIKISLFDLLLLPSGQTVPERESQRNDLWVIRRLIALYFCLKIADPMETVWTQRHASVLNRM